MCQGRAFIVEVLPEDDRALYSRLWLWVRVFVRFSGIVGQHLVEGWLNFFGKRVSLSHAIRMHCRASKDG
jgi:hypothetical protein